MLFLAACGPEPGGDSDSAGGSSSETGDTGSTAPTTGDVPPAALCVDDGAQDWLCDPVRLGCEQGDCDPKFWWGINDEARLECALAALRDRTPGKLQWSLTFGFEVATAEEVTLSIRGDGTALREVVSEHACTRGPNTHATLRDAEHFAGCLAEADARARFLCMHDAVFAELAECAGESKIECPPAPSSGE